jgi:LuxR family maltose regulon positive regulatory protein
MVPLQRACLIPRPRLTPQLERAQGGDVILISAPAGFGKTTLVTEWAAGKRGLIAWLSLDEADNDPVRFWRYIVASLRTVFDEIGQEIVPVLESEPVSEWEPLVTQLINDISNISGTLTLVLDDYHLIRANAIHSSLSFLLHHQPPQLRIVITTRADPPLALARLRVQGRLWDIRAADLRFTQDEMEAFFDCAVTAKLPSEAIKALTDRTEGWAAGLQLAALSLRGLSAVEAARSVMAFDGAQRYVLNYLLEEVLDHQEPHIQKFLLHTSVLHNLTPQLCTVVTGYQDTAQILGRLAEEDLFIQPLDETGQWYRYDRLFARALVGHLERIDPDLIPELRRRASAWYAERSASEGLPARLQPALVTLSNPFVSESDEPVTELLTERESEILALISQGLSNQQIADHLVITVGTVKGHVTHVLDKLNAQSRTEAVARARYLGLLKS